jgi:anti-sigma B factor antagonist
MEHAGHDINAAAVDGNGLKIAVSTAGPTREISIVRVDGAVDTMTAGDLEQVISSLIARGRYRLVVDLAGVEYISSAGWGVFVSHLREIRERAGDIKLARMTPDVREIYELLEFDGLLPYFDELDSAVAEFQGPDNRRNAAVTPVPAARPSTSTPTDKGKLPEGQPLPTLDEVVMQLVAEDPFQTIGEMRQRLQENHGGRRPSGWWKVFGSLRRQHMLTRRARFRYCRRMRKTFM